MSCDYRAADLNDVRRALVAAVELSSFRRVADAVGVGRTTLAKFVSGETRATHPRVKRLLGIWYLTRRDQRPGTAETLAALELVLDDIAAERRPLAIAALLGGIRRIYIEHEGVPPAWIESVREQIPEVWPTEGEDADQGAAA